VLELNTVNLVNEHLVLNNAQNANQPGLFDTPGLLTQAQPAGTGLMFGTGILRVIGGPSTITGNVDIRTAGNTQFFGISGDSGSSLLIDGVLYGSNNGTSNLAQNLVKLGGGSLELRGANSANVTGFTNNPVVSYSGQTVAGQTIVIGGTLTLNKTGTAISGTLAARDGPRRGSP